MKRRGKYIYTLTTAGLVYILLLNLSAVSANTEPVSFSDKEEPQCEYLPAHNADRDFCTLPFITCGSDKLITGIVSAYNNVPEQCDSTPDQAAGGFIGDKAYKVVANNCLPLHSKVEINGREYEVFDRMNKRYGCEYFDIFMGLDIKAARSFGRQKLTIKIINL